MVKDALFVHRELIPSSQGHKGLPDVETSAKVRVCKNVLVANTWTGVPWCVLIEGVPFLDSWHLEELKESETEGESQIVDDLEELHLSPVHVRVNVEKEHDVDDGDKLREVLDRAPCPQKDEDKELKEVRIRKVHIVDVDSELVREHELRPEEVARGLHEVEDQKHPE